MATATLTGGEQLVLNTQERAVSTDVNRLQAFRTRDMAEAFRNMIDLGQGTDDLDAGGLYQPTTSTTTPLTADVEAGLLVQPQVGSLNLLVTAGLAWCITPQTSADNSVYEYVNDPGVSTLGALVESGNATGSIRIDVIECQPNDVVLETDNRDIFNPATGLFTATNVTKAVAAQMVYRVRQGTAGSGFPGLASGWLPLAVVSVAAGATTCDQMTFWDVRPLTNDHVGAATYSRPQRRNSVVNAATNTAVSGNVDYVEPTLGRRLGGRLRTGVPIADAQTVDITNAANQDASVAGIAANAIFFVWLVAPFGLPRWARYTDYTSGIRQPRSPRGILVVSAAPPRSDGTILSGLAPQLPVSTGLGSTTITAGVCVASGFKTSGVLTLASEEDGTSYFHSSPTLTMTPSGTSATMSLFALFPADATELYVYVDANITPAGSGGSYKAWQPLIALPESGSTPLIMAGPGQFNCTSAEGTVVLALTDLEQGATITAFTIYASCLSADGGLSSFAIYKVSLTTGSRTQTQIGTTTPGPAGAVSFSPIIVVVTASEVVDNTLWAYYAVVSPSSAQSITWSQVAVTGTAAASGTGGSCTIFVGNGGNGDQAFGGYFAASPAAQDVQFTGWVSLLPVVPAGSLPSTTLTLVNSAGATINSASCAVLGWRRAR